MNYHRHVRFWVFAALITLTQFSCYEYEQFVRRGLAGENLFELEVYGEKMTAADEIKIIELDGFTVDDFADDTVKSYIKGFQTGGRKWFQAALDRGQLYLPYIKKIFKQYDIPEDLAYLPIIESEFVINCKSHAGAYGIWQFMAQTAVIYDLRINYWVDERKDPIKSTHAAAKHLKRLYPNFKSWVLALAAYNAGGGKISRSIKRYKTNVFWELVQKKALADETRRYIPKFIAATMIAKNPERYGFKINTPVVDFGHYDVAYIDDAADIKMLAAMIECDQKTIMTLNPELNQWITPPKATRYPLRLPKGKAAVFNETFAKIPPEERVTFRQHTLRMGESLWQLSAFYNVPVSAILDVNRLKSSAVVQLGQRILIPVSGLGNAKQIDEKEYEARQAEIALGKYVHFKKLKPPAYDHRDVIYCVGRGESLWSIAMKYRLNLDEVRAWNSMQGYYAGEGEEIFLRIPVSTTNRKP